MKGKIEADLILHVTLQSFFFDDLEGCRPGIAGTFGVFVSFCIAVRHFE